MVSDQAGRPRFVRSPRIVGGALFRIFCAGGGISESRNQGAVFRELI